MLLALALAIAAQDQPQWSRFRGPEGAGVATDGASYPAKLDPEENLLWKTALPRGHSSPCVHGNRIFLTGEGAEDRLETICLNLDDGAILWRKSVEPLRTERLHDIHSPATPTACTDGETVVVYFGGLGLVAYDFAGTELWRREVEAARNTFGTGSSPVIVEGKLLFPRDVNEGSYLEALEPATGDLLWRADRSRFVSGWSTPGVRKTTDGNELLVYGAKWLTAYDLEDGKERWSVPGLTDEPIITPVVLGNLVYVSSYNMKTNTEVLGLPTFEVIVKELDQDGDGTIDAEEAKANASILSRHDADGEGDHPLTIFFRWLDADKDGEVDATEWVTIEEWVDSFAHLNGMLAIRPGSADQPAEILWQHGRGVPECPSPVAYGGNLYFVKNGGIATCLDAATGELRFEGRTGARGPCYASPVAGDGKLYTTSARGQVVVLAAGDELKVLSATDLEERIMATPALVNGKVLLRTEEHLYLFGE